MTLSEAIAAANQGDVRAMINLAEYYWQGKNLDEASVWYEKAANCGLPYAIDKMVLISNIIATSGLNAVNTSEFGWEFAKDDWKAAYDWACKEKRLVEQSPKGLEGIDPQQVHFCFLEAGYFLALCCHKLGDSETAFQLVKDFDFAGASILAGVCIMDLAKNNQEFNSAFNYLYRILDTPEYHKQIRIEYEEYIYALGALGVSLLVREGIPEMGITANTDQAFEVLSHAVSQINDEASRELLMKDLSRYQKKMFGGYRYV